MKDEIYFLIASLTYSVLVSVWIFILLINKRDERDKWIKKGIGKAYADMSVKCNKIQYRKVSQLFKEMINEIERENGGRI